MTTRTPARSSTRRTHSWTSGPLDRAVAEPLAISLRDGRVLVHGATADGPSFQIFDPDTADWLVASPAPPELDVRALVVIDGGARGGHRHQLRGRRRGEEGAATPTAAIYEPVTIGGRPLPVPITGPGRSSSRSRAGTCWRSMASGLDDAMAPVERFDGESAKWRSVEPMPVVRDPRSSPWTTVEYWSPAASRSNRVAGRHGPAARRHLRSRDRPLVAGADLHEPRADGYAIVLPGGDVLVLGGTADVDEEGETLFCAEPRTVERFDPSP